MPMNLTKSRLFRWLLIAVIGSLLTWGAVRHFDQTQAAARGYVERNPMVMAKVGAVTDIALSKIRYMDPSGAAAGCFAEYFFIVSGTTEKIGLRVVACGSREAPDFQLQMQ